MKMTSGLDVEQLLELAHGVLRAGDGVPYGPGVLKDLVVVAAGERLVPEKVDLVKLGVF